MLKPNPPIHCRRHGVMAIGVISLMLSTVSAAQLTCPQDFTAATFSATGDLQTLTLPATTDTLIARATGAGGGSSMNASGGSGAVMEGRFAVTGGSTLQILVGATGTSGSSGDGLAAGGGGGGASFIGLGETLAGATPLLIAGGGGGAGSASGASGGAANLPGDSTPSSGVAGGAGGMVGGDGGAGDLDPNNDGENGAPGGAIESGGSGTACAAGGAGLASGGSNENGVIIDASALLAGGQGGSNSLASAFGGFGGGGAPDSCGGGGGGYAGGGGGGSGDQPPDSNGGGGGGASLNTGTEQNNSPALNPADTDGLVELCYNEPSGGTPGPNAVAVPALSGATLALLALLLAIAATLILQRQQQRG